MSLVSVLSAGGAGGTFLSWTLHYLSGNNAYYHLGSNQWFQTPSDPLTNKNAHNFKSNLINAFSVNTQDDFADLVNKALAQPTTSFHVIYAHEFAYVTDLNTSAIEYLDRINSRNVVIDSSAYPLYFSNYLGRANVLTADRQQLSDPDEIFEYFIKRYFDDSITSWGKSNLNNAWDKREFISLNYRPLRSDCVLVRPQDFYSINALDYWINFDNTVTDLFDYLNVPVAQQKLDNWRSVYYQWKKFHHYRVLFVLYFDEIIDCILTNRHLDLEKFKLDIGQEAAIQHVLLYKHNLNLKTWQLEKFIDTRQLHSLLEPNTHHKLNYTV